MNAPVPLTNALRRLTASLSSARHRRESGYFKAEGTKCVLDTLPHFQLVALLATHSWIEEHPQEAGVCTPVTARDLERMSSLTTAPQVIAVYQIPVNDDDLASFMGRELVIALDGVQDPGNLGTIIRTADWFGVHHIICSTDTVDVYNPKVVQSTMGAISRVKVHYCNLPEVLPTVKKDTIFGTFLDGESIYDSRLPSAGVIVMGNEGKGISAGVAEVIGRRVTIPSFPPGEPTSESLNVAVATAITLAEFRRH